MIEVIPAILIKDFQELQEKIKKVEPYVDWVQLDVMDGQFVDNTTWNNPADLKNLKTNLKLSAQLMIQNPEEHLDEWIDSGVERIIFHYTSTEKHKEIIEKVKKAGLQVGLAINPETPIEKVDDFIDQLDMVLVMTVQPGRGGQKLLEETLDKIKKLREKYKDVNIETDGGINLETAPKVVQAGANLLASGTAVFNSDDIEKTIQALKQNA
ncbi:MAG: ribulose-phosphate 3-epimerase [Candidatus Portnoybacteria bacterium]|nr:ribulose-phosphate 3-epimerase [Candidatus Portnoybacteria bacterium]